MLLDLVKAKTKDAAGQLTDDADFNPAINAALERYSKHRPLKVPEDLAGNASHDLDPPEFFAADSSRILSVEYPVGNVPATLLAANTWSLYRYPGGIKLRLLDVTPAADEIVRVVYTVQRREGDIPEGDADAVACLAASICLANLAALAGQTSDPTIQADVVNKQSKTDEFRRLATFWEERYNSHVGIDPKGGAVGASATAAPAKRARGRERLTHR